MMETMTNHHDCESKKKKKRKLGLVCQTELGLVYYRRIVSKQPQSAGDPRDIPVLPKDLYSIIAGFAIRNYDTLKGVRGMVHALTLTCTWLAEQLRFTVKWNASCDPLFERVRFDPSQPEASVHNDVCAALRRRKHWECEIYNWRMARPQTRR